MAIDTLYFSTVDHDWNGHPGPVQQHDYAELIFDFIQERRNHRGQTL